MTGVSYRRIAVVLWAVALCCVGVQMLAGQHQFRFRYREGDKYRIVSTVDEAVFINGQYSHSADILNRISIHVTEAEGSRGYLVGTFQTSERAQNSTGVYQWAQEYHSEFWRDEFGEYTIDPSYFMPVVRDVPRFPDRPLSPGETWTAAAHEVHDFRANFHIPEAFQIPITVGYEYLGQEEKDGATYDAIAIDYTVFHRLRGGDYGSPLYPTRISAMSSQTLYWDSQRGRPYAYEEEFDFVFTLSSGDTVEYVGTAEATVVEATPMDKEEVAERLREDLEEEGMGDADVRTDDEGVTISIDSIYFPPDSPELVPSEQAKLRRLARVLDNYKDRDLLIVGHTALAGTAEGRQKLSDQRARAVGDYLLNLGARTEEQIITKGLGARRPVADNSSEAGMRKNRRVEITILEN
jgi:outer membrane protein OmpA-like peptidoglycan-associated protein